MASNLFMDLLPGSSEFIILFVLAAAASVILIVFLFRRIRRYGDYAYTNARVSAMKRSLHGKERLDTLSQTQTVQNFISRLQEYPHFSPYLEGIEALPKQVERSIQMHLGDAYQKITAIAPENIREIFRKKEKIVEIENIKTILIGKIAGATSEEIKDNLLPHRFLSDEIYESAIEAGNFEKAIAVLEETEYWDPINEVLSEVKETGNLLPIWTKLEQKYWTEIMRVARNSSAKGSEVVEEAAGMRIDIFNILTVLRFKAEEVDSEKIERFKTPIYYKLESESLNRAMEAENVEESAMSLEDTFYGEAISEAVNRYEETGSVSTIGKTLEEFLLSKIRRLSIQHSAGAGPLTAFFYQKDVEVRNLITVLNGISEDLKSEEISEKLITSEWRQ